MSDTQQQTSPPPTLEEATPVPEDVFEARIVVHSALHLLTKSAHCLSVYVTLHPHPNVAKVSTLALATEENIVWDHHCLTYIPNMYLQPQVRTALKLCTNSAVLKLPSIIYSAQDWNSRCGVSFL